MKYKCHYTSGGGTEYNGGIWEKKETAAKIIFTCIEKSFFECLWDKLVLWKEGWEKNNKRHWWQDFEDGSFLIYPDQCGTPHYFEPIYENKKTDNS